MRRMFTEKQVKEMSVEALQSVESGTILDSLGIDENGKIVKGQAGGGEEFTEIDIASKINGILRPTTSTYAKIKYSKSMLYLVISGKLTASQSISSSDELLVDSADINIPDEVASKIFRANGTSLLENAGSTSELDTFIVGSSYTLVNASGTRIADGVMIKSNSAKNISIRLYKITATSGQNNTCDLRTFLML